MPISPSPSYHKYDVTDYRAVHPDYGTLDDARELVREAHARGIAVLLDLVVNHTASAHPWFQAAAADPESPYRDYDVWATPDEVAARGATRAATADSGNRRAWHEAEGGDDALYYGLFGGQMPDLNFDHPAVRAEMVDVGRFWLEDVGVDGFRLDAAKHVFPDDRAADNHAWWAEFRAALQAVRPDVYLVGEVWDRPDVVAPYLRGLTATFNFDLARDIGRAVRDGRADSLALRLARVRGAYDAVAPGFRDATFLTNHDQTRVLSALGDDEAKARVAAALLLTLPGSPFLYYGEEIGMRGRKPDPNIREPFLWGGADGLTDTRWTTAVHSTPATVASAAAQEGDAGSLLSHYRGLIALRNASAALTHGDLVPLASPPAVASFLRTFGGDTVWVAHNVTAEAQTVPVPAALRAFTRVEYPTDGTVRRVGETLVLPPYRSAVLAPP